MVLNEFSNKTRGKTFVVQYFASESKGCDILLTNEYNQKKQSNDVLKEIYNIPISIRGDILSIVCTLYCEVQIRVFQKECA